MLESSAALASVLLGRRRVSKKLDRDPMYLCLAVAGTAILAYIVKALIGLRPSEEVETAGLDVAEHGEEAYHSA